MRKNITNDHQCHTRIRVKILKHKVCFTTRNDEIYERGRKPLSHFSAKKQSTQKRRHRSSKTYFYYHFARQVYGLERRFVRLRVG